MSQIPHDDAMIPTRPAVRKLLELILNTDSELNAFCLDHFYEVYKQWTIGMDRRTKVNLLLESRNPLDVISAIRKQCPTEFEKHHDTISNNSKKDKLLHEYRERLENLYLKRDSCISLGGPVDALDREILSIRKQQRATPTLCEGEILADRYRLIELVGRGGFSSVWQSYDRVNHQIVAVKILHAHLSDDIVYIERFRRGGFRMAELRHRNIVGIIHEPAEYEGFHFFVMEYLSGGDLAGAIISKKISAAQGFQIVIETSRAINYIHEQGLIHRDVKPQNIMLDTSLHAKLTDFDLVHVDNMTGGTHTGAMVGTFLYAAPEQLSDSSRVDSRADIFSLGMCAVFVAFGKPIPQIALQNLEQFIEELKVSSEIKDVLRSAVKWNPNARLASALEFAQLLIASLRNNKSDSPNLSNLDSFSQYNVKQNLPGQQPTVPARAESSTPLISAATDPQNQQLTYKHAATVQYDDLRENQRGTNHDDTNFISKNIKGYPEEAKRPAFYAWAVFVGTAATCIMIIVSVKLGLIASEYLSPKAADPISHIDLGYSVGQHEIPDFSIQDLPARDMSVSTNAIVARPSKPARKAGASKINLGTAEVRGSLDKEAIRGIIRRHINEVKFCFERELTRTPNMEGSVMVNFTIGPTGAVVASIVQSSTLGNPTVEQCIAGALRRWEFPRPQGGIVVVTYPFTLRKEE